MQYRTDFHSPLGDILLTADDIGLTGLWFYGQKYFAAGLRGECEARETAVLTAAKRWLSSYFAGDAPPIAVPLHLVGTPFQKCVWELLSRIPHGQTTTYGALAGEAARMLGVPRMSAQAVGGAVGHNPIAIIVPCHRVLGADGSLTGYAGGTDKKAALLRLEGVECAQAVASASISSTRRDLLSGVRR